MANTFELISSYTATGTISSIDFTSIPSTFTDLVVVASIKSNVSGAYSRINLTFNGSSSGYSERVLFGLDSSAYSDNQSSSSLSFIWTAATDATSTSTFGSASIYIPNYTSSNYKSVSADFTGERNISTGNVMGFDAGLWANTAAINQLTLTANSGSFVQYSTAYLYGVKNA